MSTQILMPALSPTMTEGKLSRWLKNVGDDVRAGDVIAEIETDKATMEVEAVDEGKLAQILVDEGTEGVAVNTPIAVLAVNGEDTRGREPAAQARRHRLPQAGATAGSAGAASARARRARQRPAADAGGTGQGLGTDQADHRARGVARRDGRRTAARRQACS